MSDLFLVGFKGNRKEYFYNSFHHSLEAGDYVIVQVERGEDCGQVLQYIEEEIELPDDEHPSTVLRRANDEDIEKLEENRKEEEAAWPNALKLIKKHELDMKLVDIEYQHDRNKITFFFTADHRVDFRALVRDLASEYKTRIELRQIGVRDEARRIGGFGICGLEQCCVSFLQKFEPISTQDARVQNLSLNPSKISGNCGRLLCCLKYEVDLYEKILSKYPEIGSKYSAEGVEGTISSISYFNDCMYVTNSEGEEIMVPGVDVEKLARERRQDREGEKDNTPRKPQPEQRQDNNRRSENGPNGRSGQQGNGNRGQQNGREKNGRSDSDNGGNNKGNDHNRRENDQ